MGVAENSEQLVIFGAGATGALVGAATMYFFCKFFAKSSSTSEEKVNVENSFEPEDPNKEYRLILGVRNDLKMQKGKVAAQCAHAAVAAYAKAANKRPKTLQRWLRRGSAKIAVRVETEDEMLALDKKAKELKVLSCIIQDAGHTQVAPGSRTVIAIGPAPKSILDQITGHLKLY